MPPQIFFAPQILLRPEKIVSNIINTNILPPKNVFCLSQTLKPSYGSATLQRQLELTMYGGSYVLWELYNSYTY